MAFPETRKMQTKEHMQQKVSLFEFLSESVDFLVHTF